MLIKINIGNRVHICSNNKESGVNLDLNLIHVITVIRITKVKINTNHTITMSCKVSNLLAIKLNKFWKERDLQNAITKNLQRSKYHQKRRFPNRRTIN